LGTGGVASSNFGLGDDEIVLLEIAGLVVDQQLENGRRASAEASREADLW
jgi:hypothetical protein